jgi:hypothetical protein
MKQVFDLSAIVLLAALALVAPQARAWGSDACRFQADLAGEAELAGASRVVISAAAGDLAVQATPDARRLAARGKACAKTAELLAQIKLNVRRDGDVVYVETRLPEEPGSGWNDDAPTLDVNIALPAIVPVEITDSSGDVSVKNVAALQLRDSSGDVTVSGVRGRVDVEDSSGDVRISESGSDVHIGTDSSGDIVIRDVRGSVRIDRDSSGDIRLSGIGGDALIGVDSSGDIVARDIGGGFTVESDGSGDIDYSQIRGVVSIPEDKRR